MIALAILTAAYSLLWHRLLATLPWLALNATTVNPGTIAAALFIVGGAVGIIGSWISVGRHLRA